jgi:hypothetical protein
VARRDSTVDLQGGSLRSQSQRVAVLIVSQRTAAVKGRVEVGAGRWSESGCPARPYEVYPGCLRERCEHWRVRVLGAGVGVYLSSMMQ